MMVNQVVLISAIVALGSAGAALAEGGKKSASVAIDISNLSACPPQAVNITEELLCLCPGDATGSVWGSGPYTADSSLCTAARHSGAVGTSGGAVRVTPSAGLSGYEGTTANGVTTTSWGSYGSSFNVASVSGAVMSSLPACGTMPADVAEYACHCPANATGGSVWGNGPYTSDSSICAAALHDGYIGKDGGEVHVLRIQGLAAYKGSAGNGVTTSDWGTYSDSIIFNRNR